MPHRRAGFSAVVVVAAALGGAAQRPAYRTLDDAFPPPKFQSADAWQARAAYLREHILATAGLLPLPERTPLNAEIFGEVKRADYTVSKVYFESLPGFYVTGNLYRPAGDGPFPAILSAHGHWPYGRLENSALASVPGRAINLARQGFVVFSHDMIGYNDSRQLAHTFGGPREKLWGLSLAGLQLWNSIRALDFLESLPYVQRDAIGATGASGGGTQTFLLAAVDDRVKAAAPVNMISLHMQGGCLCENQPGLRLETSNVEIAATIAPRPLLMVSATGDWTKNTLEREFPAVRAIFALVGAEDRVQSVRFDAPHNYHRESREAVYAWMARWLQGSPADVRREERGFTPEPLADALVFHQRPLPRGAVTAAQLTENWIQAARRQLASAPAETFARALRHALGAGALVGPDQAAARSNVVLLAGTDAALAEEFAAAKLDVRHIAFTPHDADAAAKIRHFDTYNRTAAGQRVADIAAAAAAQPGSVLAAGADAGLEALLAAAVAPVRLAIINAGGLDTSSDAAFLERLSIPGLRRAGDLQTAAALAADRLVLHNAGPGFTTRVLRLEAGVLPPHEIVKLVRELR